MSDRLTKSLNLLGDWKFIFALLLVLVPLLFMTNGSITNAKQETSKIIERQQITTDPVEIYLGEISVGNNKQVKLNEQFEGNDDWLNGIEFELKNTSQKEIVYLEFHIDFPETTSSGNEMSYRFYFGQRPGFPARHTEPLSLKPKQNLQIAFANKYERMKRFLETRHSVKSLRKFELKTGFVVFADGTAWMAGAFYRQDSNNPKRYTSTNNESN